MTVCEVPCEQYHTLHATTWQRRSAKVLQTPRRTFFSICKTRDAVSVISKISRLRGRYSPERSKFQSTQSAYRGRRFIGGAHNFPLRFSVKNHFGVLPKHKGLECAQRHVSVKVYFGRLPKQGSLRWDSLKNSRPFPISSFPQMFGFLPQTLRCVLSLRRGRVGALQCVFLK